MEMEEVVARLLKAHQQQQQQQQQQQASVELLLNNNTGLGAGVGQSITDGSSIVNKDGAPGGDSSKSETASAPSMPSSEQLQMILRIMEENRRIKEEERKGKEIELEILKQKCSTNTQSTSSNMGGIGSTNFDMDSLHMLASSLPPTTDFDTLFSVLSTLSPIDSGVGAATTSTGIDYFTPMPTFASAPDISSSTNPNLTDLDTLDNLLNNTAMSSNLLSSGDGVYAVPSEDSILNGTRKFHAPSDELLVSVESMLNEGNIQHGLDLELDRILQDPMESSSAPFSEHFGGGARSGKDVLTLDNLDDLLADIDNENISSNIGNSNSNNKGITTSTLGDLSLWPSDLSQLLETMGPMTSGNNLIGDTTIGPHRTSKSSTSPLNTYLPFSASHPKKKAMSSTDSSTTPLSKPVISLLTPLVFSNDPSNPTPVSTSPIPPPNSSQIRAPTPVIAGPSDVFKHAALRASTRKTTVEEPCTCMDCHAPLGTFQLRGTPKSFEAVHVAAVRCPACFQASGGTMDGGAEGGKKRGKRGREVPVLVCEVCKRVEAYGGVKMGVGCLSPVQKPAELGYQNGVRRNSGGVDSMEGLLEGVGGEEVNWTDPDFSVEMICTHCNDRYLFCSECGGGGKTRTGKWRPKSLFEKGRRTCSLPHIRIGDTPISHRILETPKELTQTIIDGVRDVFFDCLISLYAIPSLMEAQEGQFGGSVSQIRAEVEALWSRAVQTTLMGGTPKELNGKMYLTVAWIDKRHRNKGKARQNKKTKEKEQVPWLMRLALEGTVASGRPSVVPSVVAATSTAAAAALNPELVDSSVLADALETVASMEGVVGSLSKAASDSSLFGAIKTEMGGTHVPVKQELPTSATNTINSPIPSVNVSHINPDENPEDRAYTAFAVLEWDRPNASVFVIYMSPRSVFLPTKESYGDLLRRGVERIQADARRDNAPPLEHVWCWTSGGGLEHARLKAVPERLGFVPVERYVREHPGLDRSMFKRAGYEPLDEEGVEIHVTSVKDFLKLTGPKKQ
ncbi:hypothetical protein HDV05_002456 [Chytridiales sp. JEL 0842]|nr:hypothetical protein HDV05_002456 [Chytridiales sp. JEL 0842]